MSVILRCPSSWQRSVSVTILAAISCCPVLVSGMLWSVAKKWDRVGEKKVLIKLDRQFWYLKKWKSLLIRKCNYITLTNFVISIPKPIHFSFSSLIPGRGSPSLSVASVSTQTDQEPELIEMLQTQALVSSNITLSWVTSTCWASLNTVPECRYFFQTGHCCFHTHWHTVEFCVHFCYIHKYGCTTYLHYLFPVLCHLNFPKYYVARDNKSLKKKKKR